MNGKKLFTIFQWTWGGIQTLLGGIGWLITRPFQTKTSKYRGAVVTIVGENWGGISFGKFIFLSSYLDSEYYIKHEYGHCIQSLVLGPLFLIVIGIPSICWAMFGEKYRQRTGKSYYSFYTEAWANFFGGNK